MLKICGQTSKILTQITFSYNLHREKQWKPFIYDKDFNKSESKKKINNLTENSESEGRLILKIKI